MSATNPEDEKIVNSDAEMEAYLANSFDVLITPRDHLNDVTRGSLVLLGIEHSELISAVRQLRPEDYRLSVSTREVRTGDLDKDGNRICETRERIRSLSMRRAAVPDFVHRFREVVDHPILREKRHMRYECDRACGELDTYFGNSSSEVKSFVGLAKTFAYKLAKIPVAKKRKNALREAMRALDKIIYNNTFEPGITPGKERCELQLMYNVYLSVRSMVNSDCYLTKHLANLMFSEDRSVPFRIHPTTFILTYPSKASKCQNDLLMPQTLNVELRQLLEIRRKQGSSNVFLNPKAKTTKTMS